MAKRSILDPEWGLIEADKGERVVVHATKGFVVYDPGLLARAAGVGGGSGSGRQKQRQKYKGEVLITNQAVWVAKVGGLFKKRVRKFMCAVHDPAYAHQWVQDAVGAISIQKGRFGSRRTVGVEKMYFVTRVDTDKGILRKGFNLRLVKFNPTGQGGGFTRALRNVSQKVDSSIAGEVWAVRFKKMAPAYEMSEGALQGALSQMQSNSEEIVRNLPQWNDTADAAQQTRRASM